MKCKYTAWIAMALVIIGALNWGLWGLFQFDVVAWLFNGTTSAMSRIIYTLIGIAGLLSLKRLCCCKQKCSCGCSCCDKHDKHMGGGCCGK